MSPTAARTHHRPRRTDLARLIVATLALAAAACATPTPPGQPVDGTKATSDASAGGTAATTAIAEATDTGTALAPATDAAPATEPAGGAGGGQCRAWTTAPPNTTVYMQPSEDAAPFGTFGADSGPEAIDIGGVVAQTNDGWYALDPGVAQAGNVGIYRLRWVLAAQAQIAGVCGSLPAIDVVPDFTPPASGACEVTATAEVMVRDQYAPDAPEFGPLPAGNTETALARTVDGWLGFDPGVAQAGNIGLYRLRWIAPDAAVTKAGGCDALPLVFDGG